MAVAAVDRTEHSLFWQIALGVAGTLAVVAGVVLQIVILKYHSTSTVTKAGNVTTTITGPSAPSSSLVTASLGAGVLFLLASAFFSRISKLVISGIGEIDLDAGATLAGKAAAKSGGDPAKTARIYKRALEIAAQRAPTAAHISTSVPVKYAMLPSLDDETLQSLVDEAARTRSG